MAHRHSTCHVITYFKWSEQLYFHKAAKQDLRLGWSGRENLERFTLSQWSLVTTVLSGSLCCPLSGGDSGGNARDVKEACVLGLHAFTGPAKAGGTGFQ